MKENQQVKKLLSAAVVSAALVAGPLAGTAQAEVQPIASQEENTAAMQAWAAKVGVGTTIGTLTGTGLGFATGCILGTIPTAVTVLLIPAGCLAGGVLGAAVGGVAGTVLVGGPTAIVAGQELVAVLVRPAA